MTAIFDFIVTHMYLYICIVIGLVILNSMLIILAINKYKRNKIKSDYIEASENEEKLNEKSDTKIASELETILQKMQEDADVTPEEVVNNFEKEQEENSIISYQELKEKLASGKIQIVDDEESDVNFVDALAPQDEPIMAISEDEEPKVTPEMVKEAIENISSNKVEEETKKFKKSDVISPVFGIMSDKDVEYPTIKKTSTTMDLLNTNEYNNLTDEIKRQEDFLNALKEFRKNLS